MPEGNQASEQCADDALLNAGPVGPILQTIRGYLPILGQSAEGVGAISEDESFQADLPEADVFGNSSSQIRSLWVDTSTELKVGAAALTAFGLGAYIGKRTRQEGLVHHDRSRVFGHCSFRSLDCVFHHPARDQHV